MREPENRFQVDARSIRRKIARLKKSEVY